MTTRKKTLAEVTTAVENQGAWIVSYTPPVREGAGKPQTRQCVCLSLNEVIRQIFGGMTTDENRLFQDHRRSHLTNALQQQLLKLPQGGDNTLKVFGLNITRVITIGLPDELK